MNRSVLRFAEFNDEWEEKKLEDIIEVSNSKYNPDKNNTIYKCVELEHLSPETGRLIGYCNSKDQNSVKNKFKEGNILFGKLRPYLRKFWLAKFDGVCSSEIWVLTGKKVDNNFIYYLIQTNKFNYISNISSGSKMPRSDWKFMSKIKFKIPSLTEQEKIASFLSKVDLKIEKLEEKNQFWKTYKKGMIQQLFNQTLRFKDDTGSNYPNWKFQRIDEIANIFKGFTPSTGKSEYWDGGIPWLSIADMNQGKYLTKTSRTISNKGCKNKRIIPKGTLVMSFKLTLGRLGILNVDMYSNEAICNFEWKEDVETEYMYYYLSSIDIKTFGSQAAKGITLNNDSLNSIIVKIPSKQEQIKIANFLSAIDQKIHNINKQMDINIKFKKGLLQQMFPSGGRFRELQSKNCIKLSDKPVKQINSF